MRRLSGRVRLLLAGGLACAVLAVVLPLAFLGGSSDGPLSTLMQGGKPIIDGSGIAVHEGKLMDATAFVYNAAHSQVTFLSTSLIPVRGKPAGKLVHAGVYLNHSYDVGNASAKWPPKGDQVRPLRGAQVGRGQAGILFAMTGPASGHGYTMAAGLKITYRWQGHVYTVDAWSAAVSCGSRLTSARCNDLTNQAQNLAIKQAG